MKRQDFIKIIRLRSSWQVDTRKGNYNLPNGKKLSSYIIGLVESQLKIDHLGVMKNGDIAFCTGGHWDSEHKQFSDIQLQPDFQDDEIVSYEEHDARIEKLVYDVIHMGGIRQ